MNKEKEFKYGLWYRNRIFDLISKLDEEENSLRANIQHSYDNDDTEDIPLLEVQLEDVVNFKGLIGYLLPGTEDEEYGRDFHDQELIDYLTQKICKKSNLDYESCTEEQQEDLKSLSCHVCYWVSKYLCYDDETC